MKLSANGEHVWSQRFGGSNADDGKGVAVGRDGSVVVTGSFQGTVDFGGGPMTSAGFNDVFVVKLSADGEHVWSRRLGGPSTDIGYGVVVDSDGNVVVTGIFSGTADFGGGLLTSAGEEDVFVAKLSTDGEHVWSQRFGGPSADISDAVGVGGDGSAVVVGYFRDAVDFGGGPLTSAGFEDVFAVKLSGDGEHVWSQRFGGPSPDVGSGVIVDSDGNVVVTGHFQYTVDFGNGPLTSAGSWDVFAVKLSVDGEHVWSQRFGGSYIDVGAGIAVDSDKNVVITGQFYGTADFAGEWLTSAGGFDAFATKLSADGVHVWSQRFGDADLETGRGVAVDSGGNVLLTGRFRGTVNFGTGPLLCSSDDTFVVKLTP